MIRTTLLYVILRELFFLIGNVLVNCSKLVLCLLVGLDYSVEGGWAEDVWSLGDGAGGGGWGVCNPQAYVFVVCVWGHHGRHATALAEP